MLLKINAHAISECAATGSVGVSPAACRSVFIIKTLNIINFLCSSDYIYYFCRYISKNLLTHEYTAVRHIINKLPWENILKYGGNIQILLVCVDHADTCQGRLPTYRCVGYCHSYDSQCLVSSALFPTVFRKE